MDRTLKRSLCLFALLIAEPCLSAEFFDPTRPALPSGQSAPLDASAPKVGVGMVVTAREGVMALFDGRIVMVGSKVEGGVVERIASDALFVRSANGKTQRFALYPEVRINQAEPKASGAVSKNNVVRDALEPGRSAKK